jgi:hypothetical protein
MSKDIKPELLEEIDKALDALEVEAKKLNAAREEAHRLGLPCLHADCAKCRTDN